MALKTVQAIIASMKTFIRGKNASIDLSEGSIVNDIVISAPSQEIGKLYEEVQIASEGQSLLTASDSATESLAANVSLLRKSSRNAVGTVIFFSRNAPVADIVIEAGTLISTTGDSPIQFVVTTTTYMYALLSASYLNTSTGVYEVQVPIEAVSSGISGVVGPQTITKIVTSITGIDGCYNTSSTAGGVDVESTGNLKIRTAAKARGNTLGVLDGYLSEALAYPGVEDAIVFGGVSTGREDLGPVDIYVRGKIITPAQDTFLAYSSTADLVLTKQPVIDTSAISMFASSGGLVDPSYYTFVKDTNAYAGSISGQDKISWNSVLLPASGSVLVNYSYNSLIYDMQNYFSNPARQVQNESLLVKWASELSIDITMSIKVTPGYDSAAVSSEITTQIAEFFSGLTIGSLIKQSDISELILAVPGVDDLRLPLETFQSSDESLTPDTFNNLQLPNKAYAVLGNLVINVIS